MPTAQMITVPLPEGTRLTKLDVELLKATFQSIVTLRAEKSRIWEEILQQLEQDGWSVHWGLSWHADAHRGADFEQATGRTLDEAFAQLSQLARLDTVCHVP